MYERKRDQWGGADFLASTGALRKLKIQKNVSSTKRRWCSIGKKRQQYAEPQLKVFGTIEERTAASESGGTQDQYGMYSQVE